MKKLIIIFAVCFVSISLTACSNNGNQKNSHNASSKTAQSFAGSSRNKAISRSDYHHIKLGNIASPKDGTTQKQVLRVFGKPNSKSRVTVEGTTDKKAAVQYSWTRLSDGFRAAAVTVEFLNNHAIGKGYLQATRSKRHYPAKSRFQNLSLGTSYQTVIRDLGNPDAESLTGQGEVSAHNLTYIISKNGRAYNLLFAGNRLTSKTIITTKVHDTN